MKIFRLKKSQKIPTTTEKAWGFFSNPNNLTKITPHHMNFKFLEDVEDFIYPGQIIKYNVRPVLNIKMSWVTEILHVDQNKFFVDEQRFGPYKFWHHKHIFTELDNGCKITDIIDYGLPFGLVGEFFHPIFIKPKLEEIFIYRNKKIKDLFGSI